MINLHESIGSGWNSQPLDQQSDSLLIALRGQAANDLTYFKGGGGFNSFSTFFSLSCAFLFLTFLSSTTAMT